MKKVLIVNPFGIGDVLFSTPLLAALKDDMPGVVISFIGNARTSPFLKNDPRIDMVFSYERDEFVAVYKKSPWQFFLKWKEFVGAIKKEGFDTAFDLSLGSPLGLALMLAGIPRRIGCDYKGRGRWLTDKVPLKGYEGRHVVEYHLELLKYCGIEAKTRQRMSFFLMAEDKGAVQALLDRHGLKDGSYVVICPGGGASWGQGAAKKRWAAEGFSKLA